MNNDNSKGKITVLGIDLAKSSFQLHGVDENGNTVLKKKLNRSKLTAFIVSSWEG
jgi:transposase